jgi:thiamine-monophosphate kinase
MKNKSFKNFTCLQVCDTFVLGGDTNEGEKLVLAGTAIGIIKNENTLSRVGCKPGDILYSSGKLGSGNAYAISKLISKNDLTNTNLCN